MALHKFLRSINSTKPKVSADLAYKGLITIKAKLDELKMCNKVYTFVQNAL